MKWIALLGILAAGAAAGQTTQPAPAVDQSTPRGAIKVYFHAAASGDGAAMRELLLGKTAPQKHLIAAIADQLGADAKLTLALATKFPDDQRPSPIQQRTADLPGIDAKIDASQEKISGDTATVAAAADEKPFTLKRVDGKWRIPLDVLRQEMDDEQLEHAAHQIEIQVSAMQSGADDVTAGRYASRADAVQGINQQMFSTALQDHAATQPSEAGAAPAAH